MLRIDILTIFPEMLEPFAKEGLLFKAQKKKLLKINIHNLRKWAAGKHKAIDDKPFGGGLGMVFKIEPIFKAIMALKKFKAGQKLKNPKSKTILFTPRGKKFDQKMANRFAKLDQLILICGRYEGVDERVAKYLADEEVSIGDYVLMGGEAAAMAVVETVSRLLPGVIGKPGFLKERSLKNNFIEYPEYSRPEIFEPEKGKKWRVPKVLLSGDHKKINQWKQKRRKII